MSYVDHFVCNGTQRLKINLKKYNFFRKFVKNLVSLQISP